MYLLARGFAITTIGAVTGGITFELMGADFRAAETLYSFARATGFLMIIFSLIVAKD